MLSHAHEDHLDQVAQAELDRATPVIVPVADADKLSGLGFKKTDGLAWGATRTFPAGAGHITITAVPARHSENPALDKILGAGNGYWFKFSQGDWHRTIYWTGDTFPTLDVVGAVKRLGRPDLMIPHVGGVGSNGALGQVSMGARQVMAFANAVSPKKLLPVHHSTYPLYLEPISVLVGESFGKPFGLDLISEGTSVQY